MTALDFQRLANGNLAVSVNGGANQITVIDQFDSAAAAVEAFNFSNNTIGSALLTGDSESGVTIMKMDEGLDTGAIAMAERMAIAPDMTAGELHDALSRLGADLMLRVLAAAERGSLQAAGAGAGVGAGSTSTAGSHQEAPAVNSAPS